MNTSTADLAAWLLADDGPIAEDERWARDAASPLYADAEEGTPAHSARILAECAAKRAIVEQYRDWALGAERDEPYSGLARQAERVLSMAVHALARPYASREGWRDEWAS